MLNAAMSMEWKALEGQRIQAVLGAIGALPAAALVFGDDATAGAPGAPLYAAAIVLMVGAYMHWMYTDAAYHMDSIQNDLQPFLTDERTAWLSGTLHPAAYRFQSMTYGYGIASLLCSLLGLAGVYSSLRFPASVEFGFLAVLVLAVAVSYEVVKAGQRRNALVMECRAWSIAVHRMAEA